MPRRTPEHHDHHAHHDATDAGPRPPGRRRGRAPRGDVRLAVLKLLADEPMHGYQLMQAIRDRSGGRWAPSPGAIYPTINQLEDEGLVEIRADAGRKLATLTEAGRRAVETETAERADPFAGHEVRAPGSDYRRLLEGVHSAAREVGRNGTEAQVQAGVEILREARRALYLLLADDDAGAADAG